MARTTIEDVRQELGDPVPETGDREPQFSDERLETFIRRAHHTVNRRLTTHNYATPLLTDVETLVAAHFAYAEKTGETDGRRVTRASEGDGQLQFEGSGRDAYGASSPYWARAVDLIPALESGEWFSITRSGRSDSGDTRRRGGRR